MANDIWNPDDMYNLDLVAYAESLDQVIVEAVNSESARVDRMLEFDLDRVKSYSARLRKVITDIRETPRADMPHSKGNVYELKYDSEGLDFTSPTNEFIRWVTRWWANMMQQITRSDSASATNGISESDYDRQIQALNKLDAYIVSYEQEETVIDRPQYSSFERVQRAIS